MSRSSTRPGDWGPAVANGDAVKLSQMVLKRCASKADVALSLLKNCVALLEKDLAQCLDARSPPPVPPLPRGPRLHLCLDAFVVALNQSCDGKSWYTSTKELQLASLTLCGACRSVTTLTLKVDVDMPRSLMAAADAPAPSLKRLCATRVPRLRARRVVWEMPTAEELSRPMYAMTDTIEVDIRPEFADSLEGVIWPHRLSLLELNCFSHSTRDVTACVTWPTSYHHLKFGDGFNQLIENVKWPGSLQRLTFGRGFNQPIENVKWPGSLQRLTFGDLFNQPIENVKWPGSLRDLTFGYWFDHPIARSEWPTSLTWLAFGNRFNQPIELVKWPESLVELEFMHIFNQPVERVVWPSSLRRLFFGHDFNRPIEGAKWLASLQKLSLGDDFNQPIERVAWPCSITSLWFGAEFNQPIDRVAWPASLNEIGFVCSSARFNQPRDEVRWPASLRRLTLGGSFRRSLQGLGGWIAHLEELCLLPDR